MNALIIPSKLEKGDTIGIVFPSAGINLKAKHRIEKAKTTLEELGYKVKLGNFIISDSYTSGTIEERVKDLHEMFCDKNIKMILMGIGGNHSNQIIKFLDYNLIKNNPKIVCGYSDITVLHYAFNTQAGLATYYGPCAVTQFGEYPMVLKYTLDSFLRNLSNEKKMYKISASKLWTDEFLDWFLKKDLSRPRKLIKNNGYVWLKKREGKIHGELLVGCNISINRLAGTKYWVNPTDKIFVFDLVLSDGELNFPLLDACITDLDNMGFFDKLRGLIIGRLAGFSAEEEKMVYERILEITKNNHYPIVANFDIGHTDPINTLRYGEIMEINCDSEQIVIGDDCCGK